jgi:hypothetical protein
MRLPTRLLPLGAAVAMAALISAVLAEDAHKPPEAATAPIPSTAPPAQSAPAPQAAAPAKAAPSPQAAAPATPPPQATPAPAAATVKFSHDQLEQLLAPIALYPDQLLGQILMASTYPAEVVEADRWVKVKAHRALKGDALAAALKPKGWDPSVMALVPFPRVLDVMSQRLDWLRDLGTAFVAQQGEVMAAVQHLRHLAMAAGTLKTTPQCHCVVSTKGETITVATAASEPVCVPVYHTRVVYGSWPYPAYPPIEFPVPYGVAFVPGFYIGYYPPIDIAWYAPLWGWDSIDWGIGGIFVDRARYAVLAAGDLGFAGSAWAHNSGRWGAVDAARVGASGRAAVIGGAAAAAGVVAGRGEMHGAHAGFGAAAMHAARGTAGGRWGGHAGHAFPRYRGGHFARAAGFAGHGGRHWGGHFGGGHFAMGRMRGGGHFGGGHFGGGHVAMGRMRGGGHFGGGHFGGGAGPHFAMGGGGGGGHGGGHGGGGGGHGGGGGGHGGGHGH